MRIKFTQDYIAGIIVGAGLAVFLLSLAADSDMLTAESLGKSGAKFAGLAMLIAGGGMKWRSQMSASPAETP